MQDSLRVWASVYFYCVIGVVVSSGLIASPLKKQLQKRVKAYTTRPAIQRTDSQESLQGAMLGVPVDPAAEFDEMVDEIYQEISRRRGSVELPSQEELKTQIRQTLSRTTSSVEGAAGSVQMPSQAELKKQVRETLERSVSSMQGTIGKMTNAE